MDSLKIARRVLDTATGYNVSLWQVRELMGAPFPGLTEKERAHLAQTTEFSKAEIDHHFSDPT